MNARVVRFVAPYRVELGDVDVREPDGGQVLVRSAYSGISGGTELLAYRGEVDPALALDETLGALGGTFTYPFAYGYSVVGTVEASTGTVPEGSAVFAFHPHQDVFVVGEEDVVPLDGVDPRTATLLPLVETGLQISLDAGPHLREHVAVAGLGAVGILTALLLERAGARVLASEPREARRRVAAAVGIEAVPPEELESAVAAATGGRGVPLLVEASGNPDVLGGALRLLAHEGTALVCSWYGTKPVPLPLGAEFHRRRLTIRSTQVSTIPAALTGRWDRPGRLEAARELLAELPLAALATHEFPFERAPEAYEAVAHGDGDVVHAALRYR